MSIIVTGASGALGQEVCKVLLENGQEVAPIRGVDLAPGAKGNKRNRQEQRPDSGSG
jgi:NAD(P)-dependent dehydrogenase (short-subunit alcohol dehydrogenase family)